MDYDPKEDWTPSGWLGAYANVLWNDYLNYWEFQNAPSESAFSAEERDRLRALHEITESIIPCLHTLTVDTAVAERVRTFLATLGADMEVGDELAASVARAFSSHPVIRDGIRVDLAMHATDGLLRGAERRASVLVSLIASRKLSNRAAAFLDRATRLFLWGFEPETIVMCASVLEAAYEARFPAEEMFRLQIRRSGAEYAAYEYEQAAAASKVFSPDERKLARTIRIARNDTLHNAPSIALNAEKALLGTSLLLSKLLPA